MAALSMFTTHSETLVQRCRDGQLAQVPDFIAEEVAVALIYNGTPYTVMLVTPDDLEDFATGFSLSENIVTDAGQIKLREVRRLTNGVELWLKIPGECYRLLLLRGRGMAGRTGCGLCGTNSLDDAIRPPVHVGNRSTLSSAALTRAVAQIQQRQPLNQITGAVHGAAWADAGGEILLVREDVGRHNALDKLIGALARQGVDLQAGFAVITSRASFEMVQKSATAGIAILAAISAPTGLAVRMAQSCGLTLVGFARGGNYNVYAHPQRLMHSGQPLAANSAE